MYPSHSLAPCTLPTFGQLPHTSHTLIHTCRHTHTHIHAHTHTHTHTHSQWTNCRPCQRQILPHSGNVWGVVSIWCDGTRLLLPNPSSCLLHCHTNSPRVHAVNGMASFGWINGQLVWKKEVRKLLNNNYLQCFDVGSKMV